MSNSDLQIEIELLDGITFVAPQPRKVIPSLIAASDLALVPLVSGALRDAVPSKLLEAWAWRKAVEEHPVIGPILKKALESSASRVAGVPRYLSGRERRGAPSTDGRRMDLRGRKR